MLFYHRSTMSLETADSTSVKIEPVTGNDAATNANQAAELAAAKVRLIAAFAPPLTVLQEAIAALVTEQMKKTVPW
jgi:hypothetical protein